MNRLEVIHLRCPVHRYEDILKMIKKLVNEEKSHRSIKHMRVYSRQNLKTDISFHIHYSYGDGKPMKTAGISIASALKDYGLVKHTRWDVLELRNDENE